MELALSVDMLVEGRHFLAGTDPRRLGHKALAVNLSDLAAMGATPRYALLAGALPDADEAWLAAFMAGFDALAGQYGVVVGDTGMILTTADGGETWTPRILPEKQRLVWMRAASLVPGTHGFVVGSGGFAATLDHDQVNLPKTVADTAETP